MDVVVEMAGTTMPSRRSHVRNVPAPRVALGGIPSSPRSSLPAAAARRKGLMFTMVRRMHDTYAQANRARDD